MLLVRDYLHVWYVEVYETTDEECINMFKEILDSPIRDLGINKLHNKEHHESFARALHQYLLITNFEGGKKDGKTNRNMFR